MFRRPLVAALTVAATVAALVGASVPADAATASIGYLDQSYTGVTNPPTSDKPESKLWYVGSDWFADMWSSTGAAWHIFRLDRSTETWIDTGVANDNRATTLSDVLWDGSHLYIASHVTSVSTNETPIASQSGKPAKLYRYSYNATTKTFTQDSGFPTTIENNSSESMTIDKDSTGRIWATWTQVSGSSTSVYTSKVYVNATSTAGTTWGTPFVIPATNVNPTASADDISSVVAFGKNKIGVLWSNQNDQAVYWAVHNDGAPLTTWNGGSALKGNKQADDHMNLKSIQADAQGRVFAAVKTSEDELPGAAPTDPQILLLVYKPGTGNWSSTVFGTLADCHTRPQVVLDETHSIVHVVATGPSSATGCPAPGTAGTIYDKSAPMDNPVFVGGRGTPIIRDGASANMNNPTTTKQSVNSTSGMIVLASNNGTKRYWHADVPLSATTPSDVTPPSTPTNLAATAPTSTSVNLSWTASTDNVGVTGYRVYRNDSATPLATVTSGTSYTDSTVVASTAYTYQVSAIDAAGNQSQVANVAVTTPAAGSTDTQAPTAPTNLTATAPTSTSVNLSWTASTDNVGVTGYKVYRGGTLLTTVTSGTSYTDATVTANTSYSYTVAAFDAAGNVSSPSTVAQVTTPPGGTSDTTPPTTPGSFTATPTSSTSVSLSWTASTDNVGVTGYKVSRNGTLLTTLPSSSTGYTDSTVAPSTTYTYTVVAVDAAGNPSTPASATVSTPSGGSTGGTFTFTPTNDATVNKGSPTTNYGTANRIIAGGSPLNSFFVQFNVSGLSGCTVTSAKLQLTVGSTTADNAPYGGDVYGVPTNTWSETTVNWSNQPAASSTMVASIPTTVKLNTAYTWTVTPLVTGNGLVSMKVVSANSDAAKYWSKEGSTSAQMPQLQVTCS